MTSPFASRLNHKGPSGEHSDSSFWRMACGQYRSNQIHF